MEKLEQLGFTVPRDVPEDVQQKISAILANVQTQYEQVKDVLWCCLDEPADGQAPLSPTDAFHAVTSEINGLLVQVSQIHRLYSQQLSMSQQAADALQQQLRTTQKLQ